jgi:predicted dehydrogenase
MRLAQLLVALILSVAVAGAQAREPAKKLRVGIIGLDTSHVVAFTKGIKKEDAPEILNTLDIVAGYPGGSADIPDSADRVEKFTEQLRDMGVEIVGSIDELLMKVDAVLLESVDGRPHLAQARPVIKAGKPLFIDKPVAGTLADAIEIFDLAAQAKVPVFSSSSLRFSPGIQGMRTDP